MKLKIKYIVFKFFLKIFISHMNIPSQKNYHSLKILKSLNFEGILFFLISLPLYFHCFEKHLILTWGFISLIWLTHAHTLVSWTQLLQVGTRVHARDIHGYTGTHLAETRYRYLHYEVPWFWFKMTTGSGGIPYCPNEFAILHRL